MSSDHQIRNREDEIDLRMIFSGFRKKWRYFLASVIFFSAASLLYLHFRLPEYQATASIIIKDDKSQSKSIEDFLTGDLYGNTKNLATEIGILRSRSVIEETIDKLNLQNSYYSDNSFIDYPLYRTSPFLVKTMRVTDGIWDEKFSISLIDTNKFKIDFNASNFYLDEYNFNGTFSFGEEIKTPHFTLVIERNDHGVNSNSAGEYYFIINSMNRLITDYTDRLTVKPLNKEAKIVEIAFQDRIPNLAGDFLDELIKVYIDRDVQDKSSVAGLTLKFVDQQLDEISKSLNTAEVELQKFKEAKGTVNLSEESKAYLERVTTIEENRIKSEMELRSLDFLYDYVKSNRDMESLAPSTIGSPDPVLIGLVTKLGELQNKRKSLAYGSSTLSPSIKIIDEQIEQTKLSLVENINSIRSLARNNLQELKSEIGSYEGLIRKIPNIERELLSIQRTFAVNQNIYLFLLQKKAETGIAKATAVSDNKVLDVAFINDEPVVPNKKGVAAIALILALLVPALLITFQGFFGNTINSRSDVEKLTNIPIIGVVGHQKGSDRLAVASKPKSSIAEAFRSIRANLMFFGLADKHKIVLVTSSVGGEGKSFSALNLACVLSLQNFRVVILGMDLRKPQLVEELEIENTDGVSTLLIGKTTLDKVIHHTKVDRLDIIPSGPVPPNPAELLSKPETSELLEELKNRYDYIIIDTPPVGIVSDAMMLMSYADINIFVLRENFSRKEYIKTINEYYAQEKIKNLCILLNDAVHHQRYAYGSGYYDDTEGWMKNGKSKSSRHRPKVMPNS